MWDCWTTAMMGEKIILKAAKLSCSVHCPSERKSPEAANPKMLRPTSRCCLKVSFGNWIPKGYSITKKIEKNTPHLSIINLTLKKPIFVGGKTPLLPGSLTVRPWKGTNLNRKVVFQPSFFRGHGTHLDVTPRLFPGPSLQRVGSKSSCCVHQKVGGTSAWIFVNEKFSRMVG